MAVGIHTGHDDFEEVNYGTLITKDIAEFRSDVLNSYPADRMSWHEDKRKEFCTTITRDIHTMERQVNEFWWQDE